MAQYAFVKGGRRCALGGKLALLAGKRYALGGRGAFAPGKALCARGKVRCGWWEGKRLGIMNLFSTFNFQFSIIKVMLEPVTLEFRIKDDDLNQGSRRVVERITDMDEETSQLIKRLEALEAKFHELSEQKFMPGIDRQMADIRAEIERVDGSLGKIVDGAVTARIDDAAEGLRDVAEAGRDAGEAMGEFADNSQKSIQDALVEAIRVRDELLKVGAATDPKLMESVEKEIEKYKKALLDAGKNTEEVAGKMGKGFDLLGKAGDKATGAAARLANRLKGGLYTIAAQAITALAVAIYKMATEMTELEKAMKRVDEGFVDFFGHLNKERMAMDDMFNRLRNAREGTQGYETAKNAIINQYGDYLKGMSDEIQSLKDLEGGYSAVSAAVVQLARDKAMSAGDESALAAYIKTEKTNIETIINAFKKSSPDDYNKLLTDLKQSIDNGTELSENVQKEIEKFNKNMHLPSLDPNISSSSNTRVRNPVKEAINEIYEARKVYNNERQRLVELYSAPPDDTKLKENYEYWTNELKRLEKARNEIETSEIDGDKWKELTADIEAARAEVEKYSDAKKTTDKPDPNKAERERQTRIDALQWLNTKEAELDFQRVRRKLETEEKLLSIDDESAEKRIRQNEINYQKELLSIREHAARMVREAQDVAKKMYESEKGSNEGFDYASFDKSRLPESLRPEAIANYITEAESLALLVRQKANADMLADSEKAMNEYLKSYGTFEERKLAITKEYDDKIAKAVTEGEKLILGKQKMSSLDELEKQMGKSRDVWKVLMGDLGGLSAAMLEDYIARAEEMVASSQDSASQETRNMVETIEKARAFLARKNPFTAMIESLKNYKDAVKAGDGGAVQTYFLQFNESAEAVKDTFTSISDAISGLGGIVSDDFSKTVGSITGIITGATNAMQVFGNKSASTGDKIRAVSGIVSVLTTIIADLQDAMEAVRASEKSMTEYLANFENRLFMMYNSIKKEDYESIFGINVIRMTADSFERLLTVSKKYRETLDSIGHEDFEKTMKALDGRDYTQALARYTEALQRGYSGLATMVVEIRRANNWNPGEIKSLIDLAPQMFDEYGNLKIEEAKAFLETNEEINRASNNWVRGLIENMIALSELAEKELTAIIDQNLNTIIGGLSDSLTDSIFKGVRDGADAWELFGDAGLQVIDALGKQLVKEFVLTNYFNAFEERMRNAYSLGDPALIQQELADIMTDIYSGLGAVIEGATRAAEEWDRIASESGWDMSRLSNQLEQNQESQKGMFQTMSQQTGSELLGQFTAIRVHIGNIYDLINNMYLDNSSVSEYLSAIVRNTDGTVRELKILNDRVRKIETEGVKML